MASNALKYGAISSPDEREARASTHTSQARKLSLGVIALALLAVAAVLNITVRGLSAEPTILDQKLATVSVPENAVRYVEVPAGSAAQAVQYASLPTQYVEVMPASAQKLASRPIAAHAAKLPAASQPIIEYIPVNQLQQVRGAAPVQRYAIGGRGVVRGQSLEDAPAAAAAAPAAGAAEAAPVLPAPITPPTPQEIAMALQRIQEREIQQQTFKDTLIDAQTGQPLHVPGVPGSSHNGVSGIGGVFGVGGFLGPSYPIADKVAPMGSFTSGPACTCTSCTGSPPVCTGCTCR